MLNLVENKSALFVTVALLIVIGSIMLLPAQALLLSVIQDDFKSEYVALFLKMSLLFVIGNRLVKMNNLETLSGLSKAHTWRFRYLNLIPVYLFILGLLSVISRDLGNISSLNMLLLLAACLMVGFAEEYLFRGFLQSFLLKKNRSKKQGIFLSILSSSVFFGLFHLLNLVKNDNAGQVVVQVIFATFIGFFFGALLLKTNKLFPIAITHGLTNFFFSLALLPGIKAPENTASETVSLAPIILFLPLLIAGVLSFRKLDRKEILEKIDLEPANA